MTPIRILVPTMATGNRECRDTSSTNSIRSNNSNRVIPSRVIRNSNSSRVIHSNSSGNHILSNSNSPPGNRR